jgi:3-hydroxymyristoyl/3-hydroxydecanoyl-(acyl carrier protein) dehydratase
MVPPTRRAVIDTAAPPNEPYAIRTLAHKRFPENVLLTDIRACSDDHFVCTGRIPADHRFFNDGGRTPHEDILFYTEVGRQASLAVTHAFLNVSLDDVFIFERSQAAITPVIWNPALAQAADNVVIEIKIRETVRRKNTVTRVVAEHFMYVGDQHVFQGTGTWTMQSAALFKRLRRSMAETASQVEGPDLSRPYPSNVVISALESAPDNTALTASLVVDAAHPYFFDHPCDHVPGMLLLEACAQLSLGACAQAGLAPSPRMALMAYDMDFTQFVECNVPTTLSARVSTEQASSAPAMAPAIEIVVSQRGAVAGIARMSIGFPG